MSSCSERAKFVPTAADTRLGVIGASTAIAFEEEDKEFGASRTLPEVWSRLRGTFVERRETLTEEAAAEGGTSES
jgi:hypothetical protein